VSNIQITKEPITSPNWTRNCVCKCCDAHMQVQKGTGVFYSRGRISSEQDSILYLWIKCPNCSTPVIIRTFTFLPIAMEEKNGYRAMEKLEELLNDNFTENRIRSTFIDSFLP